ncbi:MAG: DpnII family type II restriction endonuclease [Patescibacteria group bacterium]
MEKDPHLDDYVKHIKKIKEFLTTIKVMTEKGENTKRIDEYIGYLQKELNAFSNKSEFVCFAHACDTTLNSIKKDFELLKKVTLLYIQYRDITEIAPKEWIQALIDSQSARKKGHSGDLKLVDICLLKGFVEAEDWEDFKNNSKVVARFSKDVDKVFGVKTVKQILGLNLSVKNQDKAPDLIIKKASKWLIVEAKHINSSGGEQNKQINELINLISIKEKQKNIYYISLMDGAYSNVLLSLTEKELEDMSLITSRRAKKKCSQQKDIIENLTANKNNYWLNTAGFIKFIDEI